MQWLKLNAGCVAKVRAPFCCSLDGRNVGVDEGDAAFLIYANCSLREYFEMRKALAVDQAAIDELLARGAWAFEASVACRE